MGDLLYEAGGLPSAGFVLSDPLSKVGFVKGIWITNPDGATWPAWDDIRKAQANRIYIPVRKPVFVNGQLDHFTSNDRQVDPDYRQAVIGHQFQYALWRDPHHDSIHEYQELANLVHEDINRATGGNKFLSCPYMLDMEFPYRDGDWLLALFKAIRRLRPTRLLSWTMEPNQGGWIKQYRPLVDWINRDVNMVVVPQTFGGNMEPVPLDEVRNDMKATGIDPRRIRLFYDASKPRPTGWDGCLFHAERLAA